MAAANNCRGRLYVCLVSGKVWSQYFSSQHKFKISTTYSSDKIKWAMYVWNVEVRGRKWIWLLLRNRWHLKLWGRWSHLGSEHHRQVWRITWICIGQENKERAANEIKKEPRMSGVSDTNKEKNVSWEEWLIYCVKYWQVYIYIIILLKVYI